MLKKTLLYKLFSLIGLTYQYFKDKSKIGHIFYSDDFDDIIKRYLMTNLKKDWIGRKYGILNPNVDINNNIDVNSVIVELDDDRTNNMEYVKIFIYRQLKLIGNLFNINGLYNYINLEIKPVGPINYDNFLLIFSIASKKDLFDRIKSTIIHLFVYMCIGLIGYIIYLSVI